MLNEEKSASGGEEQNKESTPEITEIIPPTPIPDKPKLSRAKILILGFCGVLVLASFAAAYFLGKNSSGQQVACTQEAKICPDGSAVGRTGPQCEFAPCPTSGDQTGNPNLDPGEPKTTENPATADWKTYKDILEGIEFKYPNTWTAKDIDKDTLSIFLEDRPFEFCDACEFMTSIQVSYNWYKNTETDELFYSEKTLAEGEKRFMELYDPKTVKVEEIKIGGRNAVKISGIIGPGPLEGRNFIYTLVQMDNKLLVIQISNKNYENIYNDMLTTFKFTQ